MIDKSEYATKYVFWERGVASSGLGRNPESVREYLHEMLVSHEHTYKRDNIYTTVEWRSLEADRARRPSRKPES